MDPTSQKKTRKNIFEVGLHLEPCENWSMATLEQATADAGQPRDHLTARNNSQLSAKYTKISFAVYLTKREDWLTTPTVDHKYAEDAARNLDEDAEKK